MVQLTALTAKSSGTLLKIGFESVKTIWPFASVSILFWKDLLWLSKDKVDSLCKKKVG